MTLREQIQRDEGGFQRFAYQDSRKFWTIGFGRCIDREAGKGLSLAEAELMLDNDLQEFSVAVHAHLDWSSGLDEIRRDALINMALNMGIGSVEHGTGLLGFQHMLAALQAGDYPKAAAHVRASKYAKQVGLRAERLATQIETGVRQ